MNNYPGINPFIVALVRKYAKSLYRRFSQKIDLEDFQQELMISVIKSLKKFNPRRGFIGDFVNKCLFSKASDMSRVLQKKKRKTFLFSESIETIRGLGYQQNIIHSVELNNLFEFLPKGLQIEARNFKNFVSKKNQRSSSFKLIKKILSPLVNEEGVKKMKNISCIETLSVQELSKLSEMDLHDLSEKITETHAWIKQLIEKFEIALSSKYAEEAKKKLHENGIDFGTCKMKRNGFVVTVQLPKKVQWNQEILEDLYNKTDPAVRREIFKVNFSIDEKQFAKLGKIMSEAASTARSTSYGKVKISISKTEDAKL